MMSEPKRPWLAAMLAFFLGGPGFFYLGLRQGLVATLAWLVTSLFVFCIPFHPSPSIDPEAVGLFLLQAATAWLAFLSCKRINAEAAKRAESPELDPIQRAQAKCVKEIGDIGLSVIALSGFTLLVSLSLFANSPPMGEMGHVMHGSSIVMLPMSLCGVATGIGLMRAWRWARISMLVFGGLLATSCTLPIVGFLLMPGGGMAWWSVLAMRALSVLLLLVPAAIGVRWFRFFLRSNVKSYFGISRKTSTTPA